MNKAIRDFKNNDISVKVKSAKELVELCNICEKFGIRHAKISCYAEFFAYPYDVLCHVGFYKDLLFGSCSKNISLDEFKKLMNYA